MPARRSRLMSGLPARASLPPGLLLVSKARTGEAHDIFLSGNILGITHADTLVLAAAVASGLLASVAGFVLSVPFDQPSGPAIIAMSGVLALAAWGVRRIRAA